MSQLTCVEPVLLNSENNPVTSADYRVACFAWIVRLKIVSDARSFSPARDPLMALVSGLQPNVASFSL